MFWPMLKSVRVIAKQRKPLSRAKRVTLLVQERVRHGLSAGDVVSTEAIFLLVYFGFFSTKNIFKKHTLERLLQNANLFVCLQVLCFAMT